MSQKDWVLLRGLSREAEHWKPFSEQLSTSGLNLSYYELPGAGAKFQSRCPPSMKKLAAIFLDEFRNKPANILAMSMGAMIVLEALNLAQDEFLKSNIVLINTSCGGISPFYQRMKPENYFSLLKAAFTPEFKAREEIIYQLTSNQPRDESVITRWTQIQASRPISKQNFINQFVAAATFRKDPTQLKNLKQKCQSLTFITSEKDQLVSPLCSQKLANATNAALLTHKNSGHDLPLDAPEYLKILILNISNSISDKKL